MAGTPEPNATVQSVHHAKPLSDLTLLWRPSNGVMIADTVCPVKQVANESDVYYKWNKSQRFRLLRSDGQGTQRADKAPAKRRNYGFTEAGYRTIEYAIADTISDRERANADDPLTLEENKMYGLQDELMLDYELRTQSIFRTGGNYASSNKTTLAGANQWNNASFASLNSTGTGHSVIKGNIDAGRKAVIASSGGLVPNTMIIPYEVAIVMNNDPGLDDLAKYTLSSLLDGDLLDLSKPRQLWGMRILIPTVQYQTTVEGEADSLSAVWGKDVWIGYINPNPGRNSLTFALTFRKDGFATRSWREEATKETVYEVSINQTEQLVTADCGYLIINAIA